MGSVRVGLWEGRTCYPSTSLSWVQAGRGRGQPDPLTLPLGQCPGLYIHASLSKGRPSWAPRIAGAQIPGPSNGSSSKRGSKKEQPLRTQKRSLLNFLASPRKVRLS